MKFNYLQLTKIRSFRYLLFFAFVLSAGFVIAQPANDKCSGASTIIVANDSASCVMTSGTTIGTTDGSLDQGPTSPCSVNFVRDDVWYKFKIPAGSDEKSVIVSIDYGSLSTDIKAVGIAIYNSLDCSTSNNPFNCFNFVAGAKVELPISGGCNQDILVRVYSAEGTAGNWQTGQGTFRICAYLKDNVSKTPILWGANGEGSFDGGLNGWTTGGDLCNTDVEPNFSLWEWRKDADSHGPLWGGQIIGSQTACNGAMLFDSDFLDSLGKGDCLVQQEGWLESPTIDLSGFTVSGVTLEFHQKVTQYQSKYYVEYSIDNGKNYTSIEINQDVEPFTTATPPGVDPTVDEIRRVALPDVAGNSQVRIRFRIEANYYYWLIDDVKIVEREAYNLKINDFYAVAPYKLWQKDQLEGFGGLVDVANNGAEVAINTLLKLEIKNENGNVIFTDLLDYDNIPPNTTIENVPMPGTFIHPNMNTVMYTGEYSLYQDSTDFDYSDNYKSFDWYVTDSIFAKENSSVLGTGIRAASSVNFTWGNIYHIVNDHNSTGWQLGTNYVDVGVSNPDELADASLFIYMYKWDNANNDDIIDESELQTVGFNQIEFDGTDAPNTLFTVPIFDFTTFEQGINLTSNTDYIIAIQYTAPSDNPTLALFINSVDTLDYGATDLRTTVVPGAKARFSHVLDAGNTGTLTPTTFNGGNVPVIRMHITTSIIDATNEPKLDEANSIIIAPNPVRDFLNVKLDMVELVENASVSIVDMNGKTIQTRELKDIKSATESFNVSDLSDGNYIMNFKSTAGSRSMKFIITK